MEIKPIRCEEDYGKALDEIEGLWDAEPGTEQADRLEVLATLVEAYEERRHPVSPPDPIDAILFRLDQMGADRGTLVRILGSRSRVSEILNGKRSLTLKMIRRLHEGLGIPAEILIREPRARAASA